MKDFEVRWRNSEAYKDIVASSSKEAAKMFIESESAELDAFIEVCMSNGPPEPELFEVSVLVAEYAEKGWWDENSTKSNESKGWWVENSTKSNESIEQKFDKLYDVVNQIRWSVVGLSLFFGLTSVGQCMMQGGAF